MDFRLEKISFILNYLYEKFLVPSLLLLLDISGKAINFWSFQKQLEIEFQKVESKKKIAEMQKLEQSFNDKMLEAANQVSF